MIYSIDPELVATIVNVYVQVQNAKYLAMASYMLLVYDILIHLDNEIIHIWSSRWSFARVIYYLNRFLPLLILPCESRINVTNVRLFNNTFNALTHELDSCKTALHAYTYSCLFCGALISVIARCWVLFDRKQTVLILLLSALVACFIPSISILGGQIEHLDYLDNPLPGVFTGCFIIQTPQLWLPYIFPFIFETVVFAVTVWRTRKLLSEFGTMPLVKQLLKDGSFFYAAILVTVLFTCIGAAISSIQIAAVGSGFYPAFGSVMCNRLICSLYTFSGSTAASTLTRDTLGTFGLGIPMATFETGGNTTLGGHAFGLGDERSV
ncbi:hypothetical protein FRC12_021284 [Ceratobasidium sp. 428]|nr:hypothetical protein FRC12_021284 [Ceratobasidium sp. 428]